MVPELVTRKDTVPWGAVAWSALKRIEPPFIMPLPRALIGPPMSASETFTTVPGRLGAGREELGRNPKPLWLTPPRRPEGPEEGPMAPTATDAEATRAITAAASEPTTKGRLMALIYCRHGRSGWRPVG